jgi:hypothetical protein
MSQQCFHRGTVFAGAALLVVACSHGDEVVAPDVNLSCIQVEAVGQTQGDHKRLRGYADFTIDGVTSRALVGLYLFDPGPTVNDGFDVEVQYQFAWEGEDSFLTANEVFMQRILSEDQYHFNVPLKIVAGSGRFTGMEGQHPFSIDASITFTPAADPSQDPKGLEEFRIAGQMCS